MKRFVFKLQAVLTLRQRTEHAALEKYCRAVLQRQSVAVKLTGAEMELSEARRQWLNALADGVPAASAAQMQAFCRLLEERKQQCEESLQLAEVELNQAGQRMLHARQQREALEMLLARQRERYDRQQREADRRMMDDLAGARSEVSRRRAAKAGGAPSRISNDEFRVTNSPFAIRHSSFP
jgi:flagellar FliJ protein